MSGRYLKRIASSAATLMFLTSPASAYPIDCAILLCLSGGWSPSVECSAARAEFIRRITPFPVEPPLQIWRCPLQSAALETEYSPLARLRQLAVTSNSKPKAEDAFAVVRISASYPMSPAPIWPLTNAQALHLVSETADVDISGPDFDFVRSIRVWHVKNYSHVEEGNGGDCAENSNIELGTYSTQGAYSWQAVSPQSVPAWTGLSTTCGSSSYRGVGIEWRDYEGRHGFEVVRY
jgi:hypothetical protein